MMIFLILTACSENEKLATENGPDLEKINMKDYVYTESIELEVSENMKVFIDPSIEATNLVMEMIKDETGYSMYRDSNYMNAQVDHFLQYKDHRVFGMAYEMCKNGFSFDAISGNLHSVNEKGDIIEGLIVDEATLERAGGPQQLKAFVDALYEFRAVSDYDTYFQKNKDFYMEALELAKKHLMAVNLTEEFSNFYGYSLNEIKVCIIPDSLGGFGISNTYKDHIDAIPTLPVYEDEVDFISFLVHELSHPYINPQTSRYPDLIKDSSHLFEPIKDDMASQAYPLWEHSLNEHIVRACTILIMDKLYGNDESSALLSSDLSRKFIYLEPVIKSLKNYSNNREIYLDISSYIEVLLMDITNLNTNN